MDNIILLKKEILPLLESKINRKLTELENEHVIKIIQKTVNKNTSIPINQLYKVIIPLTIEYLENVSIDIQQYLLAQLKISDDDPTHVLTDKYRISEHKSNININKILGLTKDNIRTLLNPNSNLRKAYLLLDRRYKASENDAKTITSWNFINSTNVIQGSVNSNTDIQNIIGMRVYDFFLPIDVTSLEITGRMSLLIYEFSSQAFIAHEERKFHFLGQADPYAVDTTGSLPIVLVRFNPRYESSGLFERDRILDMNSGIFRFNQPIKRLETLTISLTSNKNATDPPDDTNLWSLLPMPQEYYPVTYLGSSIIQTTSNQFFFTGGTKSTRVFINNFTTNNPTADAQLITLMNNKNGLCATPIAPAFLFQYLLQYEDPQTGVLINLPNVMLGVQSATTMYMEAFRVLIPLEFTYIVE
jgi:hypothetical protein